MINSPANVEDAIYKMWRNSPMAELRERYREDVPQRRIDGWMLDMLTFFRVRYVLGDPDYSSFKENLEEDWNDGF